MEPPNGMSAHDGHGRASRPVCAAAVFAIIVPGLRAVLLVAEVVSLAKRRHGSCCSNQVGAVALWQVSCSARLRLVSSCHDSCVNQKSDGKRATVSVADFHLVLCPDLQ